MTWNCLWPSFEAIKSFLTRALTLSFFTLCALGFLAPKLGQKQTSSNTWISLVFSKRAQNVWQSSNRACYSKFLKMEISNFGHSRMLGYRVGSSGLKASLDRNMTRYDLGSLGQSAVYNPLNCKVDRITQQFVVKTFTQSRFFCLWLFFKNGWPTSHIFFNKGKNFGVSTINVFSKRDKTSSSDNECDLRKF